MTRLKGYEYVIEISRRGGISQAAEALGMSQPTLSKHIKRLEGDLGVELFDRSTVPLRLTEAGNRFVAAGLHFLDIERQLEKQLEEIKLNKRATVNIGISPSRAPYLIPSVIEQFRSRHPSARVVVKERTTSELSSLLRAGELDIVISLLDEESAGFERIDLFEEDVLVAVRSDHNCDGADALDVLRSSTLIQVGKGLNLCRAMNEITEALSIPSPEIECQSIESALALVKRGIGATMVPSYVEKYGSEEQKQALKFLPIPNSLPGSAGFNKRRVCLFYRKEQFLSDTERELISCIVEITKK